jgi:hypothetical protein
VSILKFAQAGLKICREILAIGDKNIKHFFLKKVK